MSENRVEKLSDLLNLTFDDGTDQVKHFQMLLKILVTELSLGDMQVSMEDPNLMPHSSNVAVNSMNAGSSQHESDPVLKVIPGSEVLISNLCKDESNPILDMLNLLNITKRLEAAEISIQNISSLLQNVLKNQTKFKGELSEIKQTVEDTKVAYGSASSSSNTAGEGSAANSTSMKTPRSSEDRLIQGCFESYELSNESSSKSESQSTRCGKQPEIEHIVKQQLDIALQEIAIKVASNEKTICMVQKKVDDLQENVDDAMFACEQIDMKVDETMREINDFNSKIFCLKTDVKSLLSDAKDSKEKFVSMDEKYETMNNVKTNKSYVDELLRQKAFASDLEFLVKYEDFDDVTHRIQLSLKLLDSNFERLQLNLKKSLACLKAEVDGKLEKNELQKFKQLMASVFDDFLEELKELLRPLMKSPVGNGGFKNLTGDLNCISCDNTVKMVKTVPNIPKLDSMAQRFNNKLDKFSPKTCKALPYRDILGLIGEGKKQNEEVKGSNNNLLNFPNSQPCFIISKDNTICMADPLKCLSNPKYSIS